MLYSPWKSGIILQSSEHGAASKVHLVVTLLAKHNQWGSGTVDRTPSTEYLPRKSRDTRVITASFTLIYVGAVRIDRSERERRAT